MYEWIREADVYRHRKALAEAGDQDERKRIIARLRTAEARLGIEPSHLPSFKIGQWRG